MMSTLQRSLSAPFCEAYAAYTGLLVRLTWGEHRRVGGGWWAEWPGSELACSSLEVKEVES